MYNPIEKFTSAATFDALMTAVNTALDGIGQLAALNLQTARAVAERGHENLNALAEVRDLSGLLALRQPMAMAAVEQSIAYSRRVYEIYNESSNAFVDVYEGQVGGLGRGLVETLAKSRQKLSPVVDFAVGTAKSLLSKAGQNDDQDVKLLTDSSAAIGQVAAVKRIKSC